MEGRRAMPRHFIAAMGMPVTAEGRNEYCGISQSELDFRMVIWCATVRSFGAGKRRLVIAFQPTQKTE